MRRLQLEQLIKDLKKFEKHIATQDSYTLSEQIGIVQDIKNLTNTIKYELEKAK